MATKRTKDAALLATFHMDDRAMADGALASMLAAHPGAVLRENPAWRGEPGDWHGRGRIEIWDGEPPAP